VNINFKVFCLIRLDNRTTISFPNSKTDAPSGDQKKVDFHLFLIHLDLDDIWGNFKGKKKLS